MATYTAPTTRTTGALISASIWNTDIVENLKYFKDAPVFDGDVSVGDDLLLPSTGAVINFASGDVTITHSTNTLTFAGAASGYNFSDGPLKTATTVSVGNATPASTGAGITFPASQSASSDANTLDDYEEGDWTPDDGSGGGLVFTQAVGKYTKIGRVVYLSGYVVYPVTANANTAGISGLPFVVANNDAAPANCVLSYSTETTARYWLLTKNSYSGVFYNSAGSGITNATLSGDTVYFGGSYLVS